MVRGTGKFKQKRGGGRSFSKNMVLDENGTAVSTDRRRVRRGKDEEEGEDDDDDDDDDESGSEEEESEEESDEDDAAAAATSSKPGQEMTRAERRELKKQKGAKAKGAGGGEDEDEDEDLINPNHVAKKLTISDLGAPRELSRREREQKEKKEAQERYWKLHAQGKTDQAKVDLARLAKIRAEREAAQAKRKAETEAKAAEAEAKKKAQMSGRRT